MKYRTAIGISVAILVMGAWHMAISASERDFEWEWPNGRIPDHKIIATVRSIESEESGFLGIRRSPSLLRSYPQPIRLVLAVDAGADDLVGKSIDLTIPKAELGAVIKGDRVAVALLKIGAGGKPVGICIEKLPEKADNFSDWLEKWQCG